MSATHYIQTAIEILMIIAVIVAMVYEPILVKWEEKQSKKMRKAFKKMREYRK